MTDSTKTLIAGLLDRSGSMSTSVTATEDGWREIIASQAVHPGHCQVTLAQFDNEYEVVYPPTDIAVVPEFTLVPRNSTALLDAAGRFITEVGEALAALPEHERPGHVICLIMTDGMENSSRHWTWEAVNRLITQQREVYGWDFIFLGAEIDAVEVGGRMGVDTRYTMSFDKYDYGANRGAFESSSLVMSRKRRGVPADDDGFTDEDRKKAMGQ